MDEERMVAEWLARLASAPVPASHIPDAETIWWQAQVRRRQEEGRRAQRPIELMEWIQLGAAAATAMATLIWAMPALGALIRLARI
jgi:hypothetical protein